MNLAQMIRALRAPNLPDGTPRKHRFERTGKAERTFDERTRQGRRAAAFVRYAVWCAEHMEGTDRRTRRATARDLAKAKLKGTV